MWNLCVTCGAWLALHLWDQQSYSFNAGEFINVLLPVYRSTAQFYVDYMFEGNVLRYRWFHKWSSIVVLFYHSVV